MSPSTVPIPPRIPHLDALRGFALGGILIVNIEYFADPTLAYDSVPIGEGVVGVLVNVLVASKFYVLFSALFGYSFTLQMRSWGDRVKPRMLRRCLGLFVLGVLHGFLFWIGDILTLYAVLGLLLLAVRNIRPATAVKAGCWILGGWALVVLVLAGLTLLDPGAGALPANDPGTVARVAALYTDGPAGFLRYQAESYPMLATFVFVLQGPPAMAMFLFGLAAGKSRLLEEPERRARLVPRALWVGYGVGLPGAVLFTWCFLNGGALMLVGVAISYLTSPLLSAAYALTLLLLVERVPAVDSALGYAGRASASNYIGQSILACLIFSGYGLALANRLPPLAVVGVAVAIYGTLLALSAWWLRRHRQGPVEWVLRRLTLLSAHGRRPEARTPSASG